MSGPARMHPDQVDVSPDQVGHLVADRFPQWSGRPVTRVPSDGTVNALFRLGRDVVLRFPLCPQPDGRREVVAEQDHARFVAARPAAGSSLEVPEPLGVGGPGHGYPGWWSAWRWIPGVPSRPEDAGPDLVAGLASFVRALWSVPTAGQVWNGAGRGGPLAAYDEQVRACVAQSAGLVEVDPLIAVWDDSLAAGRGDTPDMWIHGDLMPGNLLVRDGRLAAVLDLGTGTLGDPAVDLMPMWNLMTDPTVRAAYVATLGVDDDTVRRGRGWALLQAIVALPYYLDSNPPMARTAERTLGALLREPS